MYGGNILDRTNTLSFGNFKYKTLTAIPEMKPMPYSFAELADMRGEHLGALAQSKNCRINLMWSGGIDSTVAAVSFMKSNLAKKHLVILLNKNSIGEYPLFFNEFIKDKVKYEIVDSPKNFIKYEDINITGEIGDQLFGSAMFTTAHRAEKLFSAPEAFFSKEFLNVMEPQIVHSPYELKQVKDYLWWMNFSLKYQNVQLRIYPSVFMPYGGITHFFDTEEFQLWSMNNPDNKIKDTMASYKWPAKDYIFEYTQDSEYRDFKLKVGSLKIGPIKCAIDENFKYEVCYVN
jgi:hypothetical protein